MDQTMRAEKTSTGTIVVLILTAFILTTFILLMATGARAAEVLSESKGAGLTEENTINEKTSEDDLGEEDGLGKPQLDHTYLEIVPSGPVRLHVLNRSRRVRWSSSDPLVAKVKKGVVTGLKPGSCEIYAKTAGYKLACVVKVCRESAANQKRAANRLNTNRRILLCGSSSVNKWSSAYQAFAPYDVVNTGVSSSSVRNWLKWYENQIVSYNPAAVVIYVGSNDLSRGISAEKNVTRTIRLIEQIHGKLQNVPIFYISICSCPQRKDNWEDVKTSNAAMKKYCASKSYLYYINIDSKFKKKDGTPDGKLFVDGLHPSAAGYKIWNRVIPRAVKNVLS